MQDQVTYLNRQDTGPMMSRLRQAIAELKQPRAGAGQWLATIKALTQKGVKSLELEESGIQVHLGDFEPKTPLTKEEVLTWLDRHSVTVKEVLLGAPQYASHRQPGGTYAEFLYIANSERANVEDELEALEFKMEEVSYHLEWLEDDPDLIARLEQRRRALLDYKPQAIDFPWSHFHRDGLPGKHGKNLIAHCRVQVFGDTYFIQEIQSDWAQSGRSADWNHVPRGPFVTNTEAWTGLVLRRHLAIAAARPDIKRVAWITESMRNGGAQDLAKEKREAELLKARAEFISAAQKRLEAELDLGSASGSKLETLKKMIATQADIEARSAGHPMHLKDLNAFYLKMIPRLAEKAAGTKVGMERIDLHNGRAAIEVPTLTITDAVRQKLTPKQPIYSRAPLLPRTRDVDDPALAELVQRLGKMSGSPKHVRLASKLYDTATGRPVAGRFVNRFIGIAMNARDLDEVGDHETYHFAESELMSSRERDLVRAEFQPGMPLHLRVQEILRGRGDVELAIQCNGDAQEAAAQGFAFWRKGLLDVAPKPVTGIFSDIVNAVRDVLAWLRKEVLDQKLQTTEQVFEALSSGGLAERQAEFDRARERIGMHA